MFKRGAWFHVDHGSAPRLAHSTRPCWRRCCRWSKSTSCQRRGDEFSRGSVHCEDSQVPKSYCLMMIVHTTDSHESWLTMVSHGQWRLVILINNGQRLWLLMIDACQRVLKPKKQLHIKASQGMETELICGHVDSLSIEHLIGMEQGSQLDGCEWYDSPWTQVLTVLCKRWSPTILSWALRIALIECKCGITTLLSG